ncbi:hypothetical protein C2G38_2203831 [Gigaspora rosea]|uniref:Uncharacterized protein n=1 Tax=Gigaspora rosea TaxID=44941 RepID=A0A397U8Y3_9GLOM|nr:hypothetical protein C2G38_2224114 [Gigaspora rosea]RIB11280.1 hypothetical protein C2G38_2203831 [Gigaspora rosea]
MPFMLNANDRFSDCSINIINADILNVEWQPDPVAATGMVMDFNVSQLLNKSTTTFTKLVIAFNEPSGVIANSVTLEIPSGINNVTDIYPIVIPKFIPSPIYTVAVMITEVGLGKYRTM